MRTLSQEEKHVYSLKTYKNYPDFDLLQLPKDRLVRLRPAPGAENISLPNPDLLDFHYRITEILNNASEMATVIEKKITWWKDIRAYDGHGCLNADGTTDLEGYLSLGLWGFAAA